MTAAVTVTDERAGGTWGGQPAAARGTPGTPLIAAASLAVALATALLDVALSGWVLMDLTAGGVDSRGVADQPTG